MNERSARLKLVHGDHQIALGNVDALRASIRGHQNLPAKHVRKRGTECQPWRGARVTNLHVCMADAVRRTPERSKHSYAEYFLASAASVTILVLLLRRMTVDSSD